MSSQYKTEERILKAIISNEVKLTALDQKLDFIIYYQTKRTADLLGSAPISDTILAKNANMYTNLLAPMKDVTFYILTLE